ncbi:hypothetical protein A3K63_00220 [Candidatus Micrarchaeota archaeon RBG_16_49_10]|nr:MAG: hypothetical protein A3K63_00220 [Candidatus Micrarchaeota archaeon RBG_16_49_10]
MRVAVVSKFDVNMNEKILAAGLEYSERNPELVISLGGDGTLFRSERKYPGVPKLPIRGDSKHCKKCAVKSMNRAVLRRLAQGKYKIEKHIVLEATVRRGGKVIHKATCVNDFVLRNKEQIHALRFSVSVDGKAVGGELIGDGIVIATPFGSSAYFKSITGDSFKRGIGIALNNLTEKVRHRVLGEGSKIKVRLFRCHGFLSSDNNPDMIGLEEGDLVEVKKSQRNWLIVKI